MANRNQSVTEILKLAYEFEHSVARPGMRGAEWFLDAIYQPTKLDRELLRDIRADRFDLVLVTGNPGDGKSAFLGQIAADATSASGRRILVRHDATEPSDLTDRTASALTDLITFLRPLSNEGWEPASLRQNIFVVGINKGLLVRAFLGPSGPFARLSAAIETALRGSGHAEQPVRLAVVDLNLRSETGLPLEATDSIFDHILRRLVDQGLWEQRGCDGCEDSDWCPFFANAKRLRGDVTRQRLKLLWMVQEFRSYRHATIRDLLASLAYLVVGHEDMFREGDSRTSGHIHPCAFVEREKATGTSLALFRRILYNSTFVDSDIFEGKGELVEPQGASTAATYGMGPAVVREYLNYLDPASGLSTEFWDGVDEEVSKSPIRLAKDLAKQSEREGLRLEHTVFDRFESALQTIARELDEVEPSDTRYGEMVDAFQWLTYLLIRTVKRRAFFVAPAVPLGELTRFASLQLFLETLEYLSLNLESRIEAHERVALEIIPRGLIQSDAIVSTEDRPGQLRVRWSPLQEEVGAVLAIPLKNPELRAEPQPVPYVEVSPRALRFTPMREHQGQHGFTISLETFEGLFRLARGYHEGFEGVPRTSQLRNYREALRGAVAVDIVIMDFTNPADKVSMTMGTRIRFD